MKTFTVLLLIVLALGVPTLVSKLSTAFAQLANDRRGEIQATLLAGESDDSDSAELIAW